MASHSPSRTTTCCAGSGREDVVDWEGKFRTPLQGFTSTPRPLDGVAPVRVARLDP